MTKRKVLQTTLIIVGLTVALPFLAWDFFATQESGVAFYVFAYLLLMLLGAMAYMRWKHISWKPTQQSITEKPRPKQKQ